ncbi:MAG: hypothetical protein AB1466_06695 [Actinomycetota bacterium]
MKRKSIILTVISLILLITAVAIAYWSIRPETLENYLPKEVENLNLVQTISGHRALMMARASHRGEIKDILDIAIGYYEGDLSIWITEYPNPSIAERETGRMVRAMIRFGRGFEKLRKFKLNGQEIYRTLPSGKAQYFWSRENFMIYIIPGPLSEEEVERVIKRINWKIWLF